MMRLSLVFLAANVFRFCMKTVDAAELIVLNRLSYPIRLVLDKHDGPTTVEAEDSLVVKIGSETSLDQTLIEVKDLGVVYDEQSLPTGNQRYAVLVIDESEEVNLYDTNAFQVELSEAAHKCLERNEEDDSPPGYDEDCMTEVTFEGGIPKDTLTQAFKRLWSSFTYWELCNSVDPAEPLREFTSSTGHTIEILREEPLIATVRNFVSGEACEELMTNHAEVDDLVMARVGGSGSTSTSEARETLTNSLNVDWNVDNILSRTAVAAFDIASELLGKQIPYEGQEPINFLHYRIGFEYKPHSDGRGDNLGDRVATTLIYCQIANDGGGTVFPRGQPPLRFQPENPGDLIFFEYQPNPMLAEHAACPVIEGSKSTFTQWHRLGVSPEKPWWNFENWGEFDNPHLQSIWKGPRYGQEPKDENEEGSEL